MGSVLERLERWFFAPCDGRPIFLARIGFGTILFLAYLRYLPYLQTLFGPSGIGGHDSIARHEAYPGLAFQAFAHFRLLHLIDSPTIVATLYGLLLLSSLLFTVGLNTRFFGALALGLHILFNAHNPHIRGGWAWMLVPFLLYVLLANPGLGLSIDARRQQRASAHEKSGATLISPWAMRLLQVHLCSMYAVAGWERLDAPLWLEGEMVFRAVFDGTYGRFDFDWFIVKPVLTGFNYFVWILEPAAPILLWVKPIRRGVLLALLAMHLSLELFVEVGWWQHIMVVALLPFMPADWLQKIPLGRQEKVSSTSVDRLSAP